MAGRKWKLALAALLGFSAACSSVKQAPKDTSGQKDADTTLSKEPKQPARIVLMYGVRPPRADSIRIKRRQELERQRPDSLPPVAEQPDERQDPKVE